MSSPAEIVRHGLEAAALHDENTGTPVEVIEIELDPRRAQPAKPEGVRPRKLAELAVTAHNT